MPNQTLNNSQLPWQVINQATKINKQKGYFNIWPIIGTVLSPQVSKGVPQIFLQYNYTATRNFSISKLTVDKTFIPYIDYDLVIRHNNSDGTISRYKLWPFVVDGSQFLNIPKYTGQVIKKNFSIELWALNPYGNNENILLSLFDYVRFNTEATMYGEIYYHDGGVAEISQDNELEGYRLTTEGEYYYYYDPNDDGHGNTIYIDNGGNAVQNGTVFQASNVVALVAPSETICTARIVHIPNYDTNIANATAAGITQQTIAQTKVYISLLKNKEAINDSDEYEETSVSSVPCSVDTGNNFGGLALFPIIFVECSAGLSNT